MFTIEVIAVFLGLVAGVAGGALTLTLAPVLFVMISLAFWLFGAAAPADLGVGVVLLASAIPGGVSVRYAGARLAMREMGKAQPERVSRSLQSTRDGR